MMVKRHFKAIYTLAFILIFSPLGMASTCNLSFLAQGMNASDYISHMTMICEFLKKANDRLKEATGNPNAEVNVLTAGHLLAFQEEGVETVMVAGRSADFTPDEAKLERDIKSEIMSGLSRFNREKTVFFPGGTASGTVGAFHEIAVKKGFRVVGVTSLAAIKHEPAVMTDIYLELGDSFGAESNTAVNFAKSILMLGGGRQSAREAIKIAFAKYKPTFIVANPRLGGKSTEVAEALKGIPQVKTFPTFAAAAEEMNSTGHSILSRLPVGGYSLSPKELKELYKGVRLFGFSTWAERRPDDKAIAEFKKLVVNILNHLNPNEAAIVVAGTMVGGEGEIVIEEAYKRGFDIIGTPVEETSSDQLSPKISKFVDSGKTWNTRNHLFINLIDVLITAGDSSTILNHIEIAEKNKKPVFHLKGLSRPIDSFVVNLDASILIDGNNWQRVLQTANRASHGLNFSCSKVFGI